MTSIFQNNSLNGKKEATSFRVENAELKCWVLVFIFFIFGLILHLFAFNENNTPQHINLLKIGYTLLYTTAMTMFITLFVSKKLESPWREKLNEEINHSREILNQDVFRELFKRIIPDKIFQTVKSDVILTDVCRTDFTLRHEYIAKEDGTIILHERTEYTLVNITQNELKFPIDLISNRDNFILDRVEWELNGMVGCYNGKEPSESRGIKFDLENPNIITIPTRIPPDGKIRITSIFYRRYDRYYTREISGDYFFRHPTMQATIEIIYPPSYNLILSEWLSSILKLKENTSTRRSYVFKKAVLPHVGFTYCLKKKEEPVQNMEALGIVTNNLLHSLNGDLQAIFSCRDLVEQSMKTLLVNEQNKEAQQATQYLFEMSQYLTKIQGDISRLLNYSLQSKSGKYPLSLSLVINEAFKLSALKASVQVDVAFFTDDDTTLLNPIQIRYILICVIDKICKNQGGFGCLIKVTLMNVEIQKKKWVQLTITRKSDENTKKLSEDIKSEIAKSHKMNADLNTNLLERTNFTKINLNKIIEHIEKDDGFFKFYDDSEHNISFQIGFQVWKNDEKDSRIHPDLCLEKTDKDVKILFVDDLSSDSGGSVQALKKEGYIVTEFVNGEDALKAFRQYPEAFDIVIANMNMPKMSGIALGEKIKEIRADIPVIISTGGDERINPEKMEEMGFQGHIYKPYQLREISQVITEIMSDGRPSGSR